MSFLSSVVKVIASPLAAGYKAVSGRDVWASKEDGASEYVATRLAISPDSFAGSKGDAELMISREIDGCTAFVKQRGVAVGAAARDVCSNKVNAAYANILIPLQAESYNEEQTIKSQFLQGNNIIIFIALVAIILIVLIYRN